MVRLFSDNLIYIIALQHILRGVVGLNFDKTVLN